MDQEIKDIIAKNLPAQVGDVLRQRLAQADLDALALVSARASLEATEADLAQVRGALADAQLELGAHEKLSARERAVDADERNITVKLLEAELRAEKRMSAHATSVALGLVRNTEYRQSVHESVANRAFPVPQGGMVLTNYGAESATKTDTREAT